MTRALGQEEDRIQFSVPEAGDRMQILPMDPEGVLEL